jgi:hypothetical protein
MNSQIMILMIQQNKEPRWFVIMDKAVMWLLIGCGIMFLISPLLR